MGIGRVFTQPVAPPRKFRGAIDAALTLALGSVCAFALTLGPAPLNTVAASSAAAASFAGYLDPSQGTALLPADVDDSEDSNGSTSTSEQQDDSSTSDAPASGESTTVAPSESSAKATSPGAAKNTDKSQSTKPDKNQSNVPGPPPHAGTTGPPPHAGTPGPPPHAATPGPPPHAAVPGPPPHAQAPAPPQGVSGSVALTIVETFRVASGLSACVSADAGAQPTVQCSVTVAPDGV